ncbi:MAG: hypothetical protein Q9191_007276, partial [Dirinaria sp. TL-2023a]
MLRRSLYRHLHLHRPCHRYTYSIEILGQRRPNRHASTLSSSDESIAAILAKEPGTTTGSNNVRVTGSVRTIRKQKHRCFLEIGDGSTSRPLQAILEPQHAEGLGTGTSVALTGIWQHCPPGKEQPYELKTQEVRILGPTDAEKYPLQKKFHTAEYLRNIPHLRLRTPLGALLARLRSESDFHLACYFRAKGFIRLQPPIITSSDCEGAGEVFTVTANAATRAGATSAIPLPQYQEHFFRDRKYLTVSSQLHLEAFVHEHPKVWTLSPTFRAETSDTPRHVSEFWMLEAEMRTESLCDVMNGAEDMIKTLVRELRTSGILQELVDLERRNDVLSEDEGGTFARLVSDRWDALTNSPWPRVTYRNAIELLRRVAAEKTIFDYPPSWNDGLQLEHERFIAAHVGQGSPVFVTDYPRGTKPFYMLPSAQGSAGDRLESSTAACFDLLLPDGCEVVGGSMREHRLEPLLQSMDQHSLGAQGTQNADQHPHPVSPPSGMSVNLGWYADLRRYGSVPHGGFGLGFDRLLGYLAGVRNIRDVVPWPRYYGSTGAAAPPPSTQRGLCPQRSSRVGVPAIRNEPKAELALAL